MDKNGNDFSIKHFIEKGLTDGTIKNGEGMNDYIKNIAKSSVGKAELIDVLSSADKRSKKGKNPVKTGKIDDIEYKNPKKYLKAVKEKYSKIDQLDSDNDQPKKRIIDILREKDAALEKQNKYRTRTNVLFTAIESLEDPEEIREFFKQYIETLIDIEEKDREAVAKENVVYVIGYYNNAKLLSKRKTALGISHNYTRL